MGATAACVPLCGLTLKETSVILPPTVTSSKKKGRWRRERGGSHFDRFCLAALSSVFVSFTDILRQILKAASWFEEVEL